MSQQQQEIQRKINQEMDDFMNAPMEDANLPEWFYKKYIDLFMKINQVQVQYRFPRIVTIVKKIEQKTPELLSVFEIQIMAQMWLSIPGDWIDGNIHKFLLKRAFLEDIMAKAEFLKSTKETELQKKAKVLNSFSR